jgi:glycosyltransferase involved in cell wall biosynthesis
MKIAVITPRYAIAGVPLAQIRFAQALFRSGHDVDLIFGCIDLSYDFPVTSGVNVINLNQEKVRGVFIPLLRYLVRSKPEIIFSAEDHLTAIVLLAAIVTNTKAKISGSSRVIPYDAEAYSKIPLSKGWYLRHFMKIVMWRADVLTCVSKDMVKIYQDVFLNPPHVCVYNIIVTDTCYLRMREHVEHEWFRDRACPIVLAAGALAEPKGFADLIQAINLINQKRMVRLIILGDGPHRSRLEDLVAFLNLNGLVSLPGYVENPLKYFASADVFALSSYAEGLPNVLVEAMMCGCTPVATDCPTGPREVLADGRYGYLVPMRDPIAMAAGIEMALNHPIPRELLAEAVRPFEEDAVLARHFKVLGMADS